MKEKDHSVERTKTVPRVCSQCGAPLEFTGSGNRRCPYCGATYVTPVDVHVVDCLEPGHKRIGAQVTVPYRILNPDTIEYTAEKVKESIANQLAEYILPYLSYKVCISERDLAGLSTTVRGELTVKLQENGVSLEDLLLKHGPWC